VCENLNVKLRCQKVNTAWEATERSTEAQISRYKLNRLLVERQYGEE
jgi:hypothetical protein